MKINSGGAEVCELSRSLQFFASVADLACEALYNEKLFDTDSDLLLEAYSRMTSFARRCKSVKNYPLFYPLLPATYAYSDKISFNLRHNLWTFSPIGALKFLVGRTYDELEEFYMGWNWRRSA